MEQCKRYRIPIFCGDLVVIVSKDFTNIKHTFDKLKINTTKDFNPDDYDAFTFNQSKNGYNKYFIFLNTDTKPGQIAHECKHIVNFIFNSLSIELDIKNDETECYLLSWLVNKVHEFQNKCR